MSADTQESRFLHAVAEPHRRRILLALRHGAPCCGMTGPGLCESDLRRQIPLSQPTISHHLAVLRKAGLIASHRSGSWVWYYRMEDRIRELARAIRKL